jgi:hypothetical protein
VFLNTENISAFVGFSWKIADKIICAFFHGVTLLFVVTDDGDCNVVGCQTF